MGVKKKLLMVLLLVIMTGTVILGTFWSRSHYVLVDFTFYERDAESLDLRGSQISVGHYEKLRKLLPDTKIYWKVPFHGEYLDQGSRELTVRSLTEGDLKTLKYFTELETVNAVGCKDYDLLMELRRQRPEVKVDYRVILGQTFCDPDAEEILLTSITEAEIPLLKYLPNLKIVAVGGGGNMQNFPKLGQYCRENGYLFRIKMGNTYVGASAKNLVLSEVDDAGLELLRFLPELKSLHMEMPVAPVERLLKLREEYPHVEISWSSSVAGVVFQSDAELIDISNIPVEDLSVIAQEMTYFPQAAQLEMHFCGVPDEEMAAFREAQRENYKVVWTVYLGPKLPTRTDTTSIMPARDGTSNFHDADAYNMRYCEDVIAIDIGHLDVRNVEFAAYMPHLKYLVISWTGVKDLTPLANCKELVFLEATDAPVGDLAPLKNCTALEDINVSASGAQNAQALCEMPWLKNVWAIRRGDIGGRVGTALPDTYVRVSGSHTVSGWRSIPNYYAMRDALGMFYMKG